MKYFSEKTVSSLPIPTHLDLFDLLPLRFIKFQINLNLGKWTVITILLKNLGFYLELKNCLFCYGECFGVNYLVWQNPLPL